MGFCEYGNEILSFVKRREFRDKCKDSDSEEDSVVHVVYVIFSLDGSCRHAVCYTLRGRKTNT